jgi:protein tyrosine phosphatase
VYPYDEHLVRLRHGGYINASRVQVAGGGQATYVVASAPMHPDMHGPDTRAAFWRLIWEQNVQIVVMLAVVQVGRRSLKPLFGVAW